MNKVTTKLNLIYYGWLILALLGAVGCFWLLSRHQIGIEATSALGTQLSYITIMYLLITTPLALALFHKKCKQLALLDDVESKLASYLKYNAIRMSVIGFGLLMSILFFYLLQSQSMIFCAAISAIALYFCKPTQSRVEKELNLS